MLSCLFVQALSLNFKRYLKTFNSETLYSAKIQKCSSKTSIEFTVQKYRCKTVAGGGEPIVKHSVMHFLKHRKNRTMLFMSSLFRHVFGLVAKSQTGYITTMHRLSSFYTAEENAILNSILNAILKRHSSN